MKLSHDHNGFLVASIIPHTVEYHFSSEALVVTLNITAEMLKVFTDHISRSDRVMVEARNGRNVLKLWDYVSAKDVQKKSPVLLRKAKIIARQLKVVKLQQEIKELDID